MDNKLDIFRLSTSGQHVDRFTGQHVQVNDLLLRGAWPRVLHEVGQQLMDAMSLLHDRLQRLPKLGFFQACKQILSLAGDDRQWSINLVASSSGELGKP